ncbi:MAG TPA: hypothetical protein VFQ73_17315 [Flavisolibacter sp.]|nr:hypothetical protein [Flavisolibacter sp.]
MPNQQNDALFTLIQSLTKTEKRYFSLYIAQQHTENISKYMKLFSVMDRMSNYDEKQIIKKEPSIKASQLSNLKAHLYKELLTALRLCHSGKHSEIQIREQIDFARILYNRGLVGQSLKILEKAKQFAIANSHFILTLEILQFEKNIEARHITRSIKGRAEQLEEETEYIISHVNEVAQLSSLALRMYGLYLEKGHIQNEKESKELEKFFKEKLKDLTYEQVSFFGQAYLHQAYCWYYYMQLDFPSYFAHSQKWVNLFIKHPKVKEEDPLLYVKALHNLVNALFIIGKHDRLAEEIEKLEEVYQEAGQNQNLAIQTFIYLYTARINYHFLTGTFTKGLSLIPEIEKGLKEYSRYIDTHRIMIFHFKIACLYFGAGDNENCILYLNKIINLKVGHLRSDLQCFARLLHLIAHYELGNTEILEHLIKSVYRFLSKMDSLDEVQLQLLRFLRRSLTSKPKDAIQSFTELKEKLEAISKSKYSKRSYQYLDVVSWLESKIKRKPVEYIVQHKFKTAQPV